MEQLHATIMGRRIMLDQPFTAAGVTVPAGFVSDFASIPRAFWRVLPPWGEYNRAAVVHDYLYRTHEMTRAEADETFLVIMGALGVASWKRRIMYRAVRWFGGRAWNRWSAEG